MLFDTHCHLTSKRLKKDLEGVMVMARKVGVGEILIPSVNVADGPLAISIAQQNEGVVVAVGVHPEGVKDGTDTNGLTLMSNDLEKLLVHPKVVAVGEVGLDKKVLDRVSFEVQKAGFVMQVGLVKEYKKSLIIHCREMSGELLEILRAEWSPLLAGKTVFHCCEANEELLKFAKERRVYMGVDGDVTYSVVKQDFIKKVPRELLVLETDAPYLLPEPLLSQKAYPNEPANLKYVAEKVAELWEVSVDEVEKVTTENAKRLFGILL